MFLIGRSWIGRISAIARELDTESIVLELVAVTGRIQSLGRGGLRVEKRSKLRRVGFELAAELTS